MYRRAWIALWLLPALFVLGSPPPAGANGAPIPAPSFPPIMETPVPPRPPEIRTPRPPVVLTPVPPSVPRPTPMPPRLGGPPAGSCTGSYLVPQPGHPFPPVTPPEHAASLGLNLAPGATGLPDNSYYFVDVLNGAVNHTNCPAVGAEVSLVQSLPFGDSRKGVVSDWMTMGAHTVVQVNAYPTGSSPPFTTAPIYTAYYGTQRNADPPTVINPLYTDVTPGVRFADLWNTTGELAMYDTLDWLTQHGSCNFGCDFSGYTIHDVTLRQAGGGLFYPYAPGATFRNVTFASGMQLQSADFHDAVFENVTMDAPALAGADFSGARFLGTNSISNADISGANFNGAFFSADTSFKALRVGRSPVGLNCTSFANANLLTSRVQITSIGDPCVRTTPLFSGSQVRPSIVLPTLWAQLDWSGATLVWDSTDREYLHGLDLSRINLSQVKMLGVPADLSGTNFSNANLNGASLQGMNLSGAILTGVSAAKSNFDGATLVNARLNQPQGTTTTLDGASFQRTTLDGASFNGSSILGANFSHASAHGLTDFGSTKAGGAIFDGAHILGNPAAFEGAVFDPDPSQSTGEASFVSAVMGGNIGSGQGINFQGAHLHNAHFNAAQCIGCIFSQTDLSGANFSHTYLSGAVLSGANLSGALFAGALLSTTNGSWTFQLGVSETPTAISYGPTDFRGAGTAAVSTCPDSQHPDPTNGCAGHTNADPLPPMPPPCSSAGEDTCTMPVTTIVGTGAAGSLAGQVSNPNGIVVARNGDVYVADTGNHVVLRVSGNSISTVAGQSGTAGDSGDGGNATAALLQAPVGLALGVDDPPTLYISDRVANRVRRVTQKFDASGTLQMTISAVAGTGVPCSDTTSSCGDGGDPLRAQLTGPEAVWADPIGNVYIADTQANKIRLAVASGTMKTIAGTGAPGYGGDGGPAAVAVLSGPAGIVGDVYGNLFVSDTANSRIRKIDSARIMTTVFGTGTAGYNGSYVQDPITLQWTDPRPGTTAALNHPRGLSMNTSTGLFVADTGNGIIRRLNTSSGASALVAGKTKESGNSSTIDTSFNGDGLAANQTGLSQPSAVAVTAIGTYRVTDTGHQRVRSFGPSPTH